MTGFDLFSKLSWWAFLLASIVVIGAPTAARAGGGQSGGGQSNGKFALSGSARVVVGGTGSSDGRAVDLTSTVVGFIAQRVTRSLRLLFRM